MKPQQLPLIANHTKLFRQIRLNTDYTVCDVFSVRRSTRINDNNYPTTYQEPNNGSYNLICRKGEGVIKVFDLMNNCSLDPIETKEFLTHVPVTIVEWLLDAAEMRHSNFVPYGYGWDGKFTKSEYIKRQRAQMLFTPAYACSTELEVNKLNDILDEICRTPKMFLNLRWDDAGAIPTKRILPIQYVNPAVNKIDIIFIQEDGNHKLYKAKKIIGDVTKHPGISIPSNVERVIILTYNVTTDDEGTPLGCGVTLLSSTSTFTIWEL